MTSGACRSCILEQAQDDATLLAIRDMERAGIDIITDGEMRRESYSNRFATALEGVDNDKPGRGDRPDRSKPTIVPGVTGPIRRRERRGGSGHGVPEEATRTGSAKITLPGPYTMAQQAKNEFYADDEEMAMAFAAVVNEELKDLKRAGADVIQLDEPWLQGRPEGAYRYGVKAINRALEGVEGPTVIHLCFGYAAMVHDKPSGYSFLPQLADCSADQISIEAAQPKLDLGILADLAPKTILLGVLSLGDKSVETAEAVAERLRKGLEHVAPERLVAAPDCGMKYLSRETAFGKLKALAEGAAMVRRELA